MGKQVYDDFPTCGAKTRAGTPCQQKAGWGTDHVGEGRCKLHGGASTGAPKRNKNAVKTGEYETIWLDTLSEEERELVGKVKDKVVDLIDDDIKLMEIRIRRMMQRIADLADIDYEIVEMTHEEGSRGSENIDLTKIKEEATSNKILKIEEALTRVQSKKTNLLKLKYQVENNQAPESINIDNYINAIKERSEEVWGDDE